MGVPFMTFLAPTYQKREKQSVTARTLGKEHPETSVKNTGKWGSAVRNEPPPTCRDPGTTVLTATTLIYAIGAGITADAGTRLALQLFLVKGFKVYSFRLPGLR